jgi:VanZ family protein
VSDGSGPRRPSVWDHWYRRALPSYWILLLCSTHFPGLSLPELRVDWADKLCHFSAFGLLAFLLWRFAESLHRPASGRRVWLIWSLIGLYAAMDEWTQPYFGRGCDVFDWTNDMVGVGIVLGLLEWRRRWVQRSHPVCAGTSPVDFSGPKPVDSSNHEH